jgi:uncharacterized protein (TIGR02594 family)
MEITELAVANRFVGLKEGAGAVNNPLVVGMLQLDATWVEKDETAWCSAFVNFVCYVLGLPRSRSLAARSWLLVGRSVALTDAVPGFDVVVLQRGGANQPGAAVIQAPGHVGFYGGRDDAKGTIAVLGGNQGDAVNVQSFPKSRILGIRRLL